VYEALYIDLGMEYTKFVVLSNCDNWSIRDPFVKNTAMNLNWMVVFKPQGGCMDKDYLPATCSKTSHRSLCELHSRFKLENSYIRTIGRFSFAFGFLHKRGIVLNSIYRAGTFCSIFWGLSDR
jgi:hypothetical protein